MARFDDAGELNRRITFQRFIGEGDLVGDYAYLDDANWEDEFTTWAELRTIGGREFYAAGQEQGETTHNIKVRWRAWPWNVIGMRAMIEGRRFRLLSPPMDLDIHHRYQHIKAAEVWP